MIKTTDSALGSSQPWTSRKVAVVGAGVAGLSAARELLREGHAVTVFEQKSKVGGTWVYDPDYETEDPLGVIPTRRRVHSSTYASLHTNLPREIMSFTDFPFLPSHREGRDDRRFPGHAEVATYLHDFATIHGLLDIIHFDTVVEDVRFRKQGDQIVWTVRSRPANGSAASRPNNAGVNGVRAAKISVNGASTNLVDVAANGTSVNEAFMHDNSVNGVILDKANYSGNGFVEEFDAVVVCNGHFSEPKLADIPGLDEFPVRQMHSHNYRDHNSFENKIVVIIGNRASAEDISKEISKVAKEVHISGRTWSPWSSWSSTNMDFSTPKGPCNNIWLHLPIKQVCGDGSLKFTNGRSVSPDIIMHCTGYSYYIPFLHTQGEMNVNNICLEPLYEHVFPPSLAPSLSFVGIPYTTGHVFRMCELQSRWIAMALSRKIKLPSPQEMMDLVHKFSAELKASGIPKHMTHNIVKTQYEYDQFLAEQTRSAPMPNWREKFERTFIKFRLENHEIFREEWVPDELILEETYASLKEMQLQLESSQPLKGH